MNCCSDDRAENIVEAAGIEKQLACQNSFENLWKRDGRIFAKPSLFLDENESARMSMIEYLR